MSPKPPDPPEGSVEHEQVRLDSAQVDFSATPVVSFYTNFAQGQATLYDIRLMFSNVHGAPEHGKVLAEQSLHVLMSPELAASVHSLLGRIINDYKAQYGELRAPKKKQE